MGCLKSLLTFAVSHVERPPAKAKRRTGSRNI